MKIYKFSDKIFTIGHDNQDYFIITRAKYEKQKGRKRLRGKNFRRSIISIRRLNGEILSEFGVSIQFWTWDEDDENYSDRVSFWNNVIDKKCIIYFGVNSDSQFLQIDYGEITYADYNYEKFKNGNVSSKTGLNTFFMSQKYLIFRGSQGTYDLCNFLDVFKMDKLSKSIKTLDKKEIIIINRSGGFTKMTSPLDKEITKIVISPNEETFAIRSDDEIAVIDLL